MRAQDRDSVPPTAPGPSGAVTPACLWGLPGVRPFHSSEGSFRANVFLRICPHHMFSNLLAKKSHNILIYLRSLDLLPSLFSLCPLSVWPCGGTERALSTPRPACVLWCLYFYAAYFLFVPFSFPLRFFSFHYSPLLGYALYFFQVSTCPVNEQKG